jgi:hypothetical protein
MFLFLSIKTVIFLTLFLRPVCISLFAASLELFAVLVRCFAVPVRCSCLLLRWNCSLFLFAASLELFPVLFAASLFLFADICDAVSVCDATPLNNESVADPIKKTSN